MRKSHINHNTIETTHINAPNSLHYGAILDEDGLERPITEQMINEACEKLEQQISSIYRNDIIRK
jgi:hypothetical protein